MEYFGSGKQHYAMLTRLDIQAIQEDARAELAKQISDKDLEIRHLVFDLEDYRSHEIETHR